MTKNDDSSGESRRSILKKGALTSVAAGLSVVGADTVLAQEGDGGGDIIFGDDEGENVGDLFNEQEAMKGLMFRQHFVPAGLFTIASPVIDYQPDVDGIEDNVWSDYNKRIIRYIHPLNANVPLFPADDAALGTFEEEFGMLVDDDFVGDNQELVIDGEAVAGGGLDENELRQLRPTIFALNREQTFLGDEEYLVTVNFSPIPEEDEEAVFNRFQDEINTGPFDAGGPGPLGGGDQTSTPTGNQTETNTDGGA